MRPLREPCTGRAATYQVFLIGPHHGTVYRLDSLPQQRIHMLHAIAQLAIDIDDDL